MLIASGTSADFVDIQVPAWAWVALLAFIITLLLVDLLVIHRVPHEVSTREAADAIRLVLDGSALKGRIDVVNVPWKEAS